MLTVTESKQTTQTSVSKSYSDVSARLAQLQTVEFSSVAPQRMQLLDELCGLPSKSMDIITVGGLSGRHLSMHFTAKLLAEENFVVGTCYASHILNHNSRIQVGDEQIAPKDFAKLVGKVLDVVDARKIKATEHEIIIATALLYFKSKGVNVALISTGIGGKNDCTAAFNPVIMAVTNVSNTALSGVEDTGTDELAFEIMGAAKQKSWFVSAEQSKILLQKMKGFAEQNGLNWVMPIRKLVQLPYVFEQLYGKYASLAERIAQIYCEEVKQKFSSFLRGNLLATQKGQRGRPSLEAKREAELNPAKTLKNFWTSKFELPRGQFELLDKEKPSVLLDIATTQHAFSNLFLGIRLLHYRRPIKGLAIILTLSNNIDAYGVLKQLRYLFKKISGEVFFVATPESSTHKPHELAQKARELNIRANVYSSLKESFAAAKLIVNERDGLICVTGNRNIVADYWKNIREIKKL